MEIKLTPYKRCTVVKTSGRIDGSNAPDLAKAFKEIMDSGQHNIVLDMEDVTFMASAGWWVLIDAQKTSKHNSGAIVLACVEQSITDSLKLVGMDNYFTSYPDVLTAVGNF